MKAHTSWDGEMEEDMLLQDKVAVVYGGGGVLGGAIARAFACEGASVYIAGPTRTKLETVAGDIVSEKGRAHIAVVDALDEHAVARHVDAVVAEAGKIDIAVNAVGIMHVQGTPFAELSLEDFERPIHAYMRTLFVTAKAVTRPMIARGSGVILSISTPGAKIGFPGVAGFGSTCAAIEGFSRHLAVDLGAHGIRVICLRPDALPEAVALGSHSRRVFEPVAKRHGTTVDAMLTQPSPSPLKRAPRIADVASTAAFVASDRAGSITGAVMNLTCGTVVD
ncbi:MAG: Oxidoreductase, short chain dehydrogenase/reductase family [Labilithrix sp.]|nr:Oxidoreductase, short chain dehydrogenase/reductase family [Labilithrix sp.]